MTDAPDANGRHATLTTRIDSMVNTLHDMRQEARDDREEVRRWREGQEARIRSLELWCETSRERWRTHEREHGTERGVIAGIGTLITAALTYLQIGAPKP